MPKTSTVQELTRQNTVESVNALVAIMMDRKADAADRVLAVNAILDIGHGKPEQPIEYSINGTVVSCLE